MVKTYKKVNVREHKRFDPRVGNFVDVDTYDRNQQIKQFKNTQLDSKLLENLRISKKHQKGMDKLKQGTEINPITEKEIQSLDNIKIQTDIKEPYQKAYNSLMKKIEKLSGLKETEEKLGAINQAYINLNDEWSEKIKPLHDDRKELELKIQELRKKYESFPEKGRLNIGSDALPILRQIHLAEAERDRIIEKIRTYPGIEEYYKTEGLIDKQIKNYRQFAENFLTGFVDGVNNKLTEIKDKKGFSVMYVDDGFDLHIQKKEEHKFMLDGKELTATVKVYKIDDLDKDSKEQILKIIKDQFKNYYSNEKTEDFLKTFKDTTKKERKSTQSNLDKQLGINTKLLEKFGDMKAFNKDQRRLVNSPEEPINLTPNIKEFKNICKKCGAENTLWPHFMGNKRGYKCENCNQLSTGITKSKWNKLQNKRG